MTTVPLSLSDAVKLDGSGNGKVRLGPSGARETWTVSYVHVQTNQAPGTITNEAQCFIYIGAASPDQFVDSTSSGSTGDSTDSASAYPLALGEYVWAVWNGGDSGVQGILRVTGTKDV